MNAQNNIELAKRYVELSNKHDLRHMETLFLGEATYSSDFLGEFGSSVAIREMMQKFFTRYPDAHWDVSDYHSIDNDGVEFDFLMTATDAAADELVQRHGRESIYFEHDGLISRIVVKKVEESAEVPDSSEDPE